MTPKNFLLVGGIVLVLVGILGFYLIGPTAADSIFGTSWWFDSGENWVHLILGVVAVILSFAAPMAIQRPVVMIVGIIAVLIGLYSIFKTDFLGANLENPSDTILHIVVGIWAILSLKGKSLEMNSMGGGMGGGMGNPQMPA
ncbi:MAG: hypothetical protein AAB420_02555 [Patescibacteria group bacterium]